MKMVTLLFIYVAILVVETSFLSKAPVLIRNEMLMVKHLLILQKVKSIFCLIKKLNWLTEMLREHAEEQVFMLQESWCREEFPHRILEEILYKGI